MAPQCGLILIALDLFILYESGQSVSNGGPITFHHGSLVHVGCSGSGSARRTEVSVLSKLAEKGLAVLLGLALVFLLLEGGLRLVAKAVIWRQERANEMALEKPPPSPGLELKPFYRIVTLGDSMTEGTYPKYLEDALGKRVPGVRFGIVDKALSATDSDYVMSILSSMLVTYEPDIVTVMMGFNDRTSGILPYGDLPVADGTFQWKTMRLLRLLRHHLSDEHLDYYARPVQRTGQPESPRPASGIAGGQVWPPPPTEPPRNPQARKPPSGSPPGTGSFLVQELSSGKESVTLSVRLEGAPSALVYLSCLDTAIVPPGPIVVEMLEVGEGVGQLRVPAHYAHPIYATAFADRTGDGPTDDDMSGAYPEPIVLEGHDVDIRIEMLAGPEATKQAPWNKHEFRLANANFSHPKTRRNYRALAAAARENGAHLMVVGYPGLSIGPLRKLLADFPEVVFVDNEAIFKEAVARDGYDEYFIDQFGVFFGHCTARGNRIIAGNIASSVAREVLPCRQSPDSHEPFNAAQADSNDDQ